MFPDTISCPSLWSFTDSHVQQSSISLKMETPSKHMAFKLQDQDSLSTQSTGQSYLELASLGGSNGNSIVSGQSGFSETHGKPVEGLIKSSSMGSQDFVFCPSFIDYGQSIAHMSLHYAEPYFAGLQSAANVPQAMFHPQLVGITPTRMPLPPYPLGEPIYVNTKQYHAILRRRQCRSKLEAQNKASKNRKPYIHESRHLHALKRVRGSGGRFLNTKKLQESKTTPTTDGVKIPASVQLHKTGNISESEAYQPEHYIDNASTTSCSDVTSASNSDDLFQQPKYKFSGYPSHVGGTIQGGGYQHQFSAFLR